MQEHEGARRAPSLIRPYTIESTVVTMKSPYSIVGGSPMDGQTGIFDCNTFIGRPSATGSLVGETTPRRLLAEMDKVGVGRALVTHVQAREYHPCEGNPLLMESIMGHPRFVPCWVVLPHHTGEMAPPERLIKTLAHAGVRAVRIFPGVSGGWGHRFRLNRYVVGELFEALEQYRIPLFLDYLLMRRDDPPWDEVIHVCESYPGLPLILIRPGGRSDRNLYPLLETFDNLYLETGGYNVHRGIEAVVERYGAERLIFGSGYPYYTLTGAAFRLTHCEISEESKRMIGYGNLDRLLAAARL